MQQQQETSLTPLESVIPPYVTDPEVQRKLVSARNWLYIAALILAADGVYEYFNTSDETAKWLVLGINSGMAAIFAILGLVTRKKPFAAFLTGLIIYGSVTILLAIADYHTLLDHIILKLFFFSAMFTGMRTAREIQRLKDLESL